MQFRKREIVTLIEPGGGHTNLAMRSPKQAYEEPWMRNRSSRVIKRRDIVKRIAAATLALVLACLVPGASGAESAGGKAPTFEIRVLIANLTNDRDKIDKEAQRLDKALKSQFRYEGIRVLDSVNVTLSGDEVWNLKLPSRRRLRIRPLVVEAESALISVEISGLVQSDLKIKSGQLVIIGAERFHEGKLVIAIDASR